MTDDQKPKPIDVKALLREGLRLRRLIHEELRPLVNIRPELWQWRLR